MALFWFAPVRLTRQPDGAGFVFGDGPVWLASGWSSVPPVAV